MDALFFLRHSKADDLEIRYALRGIARHAPWVRRVVVFGDRPGFLAGSGSGVVHVPHESIAWVGPYRTPVTNFFLMFYLCALLPELDEEFLWFCDDFVLLGDLSREDARACRYLQDLATVKTRGTGLWKESLKASSYPLQDEPLTHNNSVQPLAWRHLSRDGMQRLKDRARELSPLKARRRRSS